MIKINQIAKPKKYILITLNLKSFHKNLYKKIYNKIYHKAKILNLNITNWAYLPTKTKRFTVLRSPHVNKSSREQFELKIHNRILTIKFNLNNKIDKKMSKVFLNYVKNISSGLQLKITYNILHKNN